MTTLDLGGLDLVSTTGQRLELSNRAHFSSSTNIDCTPLTTLDQCDLDMRPWVSCSSTFYFELSLVFDNRWPTTIMQERLVERLTESLSGPEPWVLFGLQPTLVKSSDHSGSTGRQLISVSLNTSIQSQETSSRRAHKLHDSSGAPLDFLPPAAAQICALESVNLDLLVSTTSSVKFVGDSTIASFSDLPVTEVQAAQSMSQFFDAQSDHKFGCVESIRITDIDDILLDGYHEQLEYDNDVLPLALEGGGEAVVNDVLQMILTAIRLAIQLRKDVPLAGMKVQHRRPFICLADVAPAVFVPTYNPFVASRAVFLPTIEHAIHCMAARTPCEAPPAFTTHLRHEQSGVALQLWQKVQIGASRAAKRRRPIRRPASKKIVSAPSCVIRIAPVSSSQDSRRTATEDLDVDEDDVLLDTLDSYAAQGEDQCASEGTMSDRFCFPPAMFPANGSYQGGQHFEVLAASAPAMMCSCEYEDDQIMLDI